MAEKPEDRSAVEIDITPAMREAGAGVLLGYFGGDDPSLADGELATEVFLAMCRVRARPDTRIARIAIQGKVTKPPG